MLYDTIKRLIDIIKKEDIDEIEVRKLFTSVRIARRRQKALSFESDSLDRSNQPRSEMTSTEEVGAEGITLQSTSSAGKGNSEQLDSGTVSSPQQQSANETAEAAGNVVSFEKNNAEKGLVTVKSPMVGTFYMARSPESDPFVYKGKEVRVGEVLCVIEAMKLMNEVESETNGIVEKILVKNAQPIEYGQPLFLIKSA